MEHEEFWASLGVREIDLEVYLGLLRHPGATPAEQGRRQGLGPAELAESVARLVALRLAHRVGDQLEVLEPQIAVASMARRRRAQLDQAPAVVAELHEQYMSARRSAQFDDPRLRVLHADDVTRLVVEVLESATRTIDALVTPPIATDGPTGNVEFDALRRGVVIRTILDQRVFAEPGIQANLATAQALGEEIRLVSGLSSKLLIVDRSSVIFPLADPSGRAHAVLGDLAAVTGPLQAYFDLLWARAAPIGALGLGASPKGQQSEKRRRADEIVQLLQLGLSDDSICRRLAISDRTLRRAVAQLQDRYGVDTRFQLGVEVAREQHLASPRPPSR